MKQRIQKTMLRERSLTSLIESYNKCKGIPTKTYKSKKEWINSSFGILGGPTFSDLTFNSGPGSPSLTQSYQFSSSPTAGISIIISSPRKSERVSFQSDIL